MSDPIDLLLAHRERFRRFARRRVSTDALAEDLVQQALLRAIERNDDLRDPARAVAWFYRLLRSTIADHHRRLASETRRDEALRHEMTVRSGDRAPSPEDLRPARICSCARPLLTTLRPAYAVLLERIDLRSEAAEAVAADLGITRSNLWVRLHRARRALREKLEGACGACAADRCADCTCAPV